ncbi:glycosyltransferase family 25 protein [Saccharata proteae CBS 121410]|uniref:Glycosyltransferase family 25 protein n=1 Tax=Saccharata proteae CBS 121410 TaxID=1314787 RepID=A0A9P4HWY0_9PEZI|nr:glycosyltransferase family 25 protein [Saccharata proteae CBS 121410]
MILARKHILFVALPLSVLALFCWRRTTTIYEYPDYASSPIVFNETQFRGPANATLGFEAVIAVSSANSPRRQKLIHAANVTELELTILQQPVWTEEDVQNFTDTLMWRTARDTGRGTVLAWLSHFYTLKWFLDSGLETALILEDDVDWDIRLRTVQIPEAAAAMRSMAEPSTTYWGNLSLWDTIYLGHCGDWFGTLDQGVGPGHQSPATLDPLVHTIYHDESLLARQDLHPFTKNLMDALEMEEKTRVIHQSVLPLCTFGYAVTRAGAKRIIEEVAPVAAPDLAAFDSAMAHGCRIRGLKCFTVNPELFHHMVGDSIIALEDHREKIYPPPVDAEGAAQVQNRKESSNIGCGFWSGEFDFDSDERLNMLREEVGRKGRCLKPGREQIEIETGDNASYQR